MNDRQMKVLAVAEFRFYQESDSDFSKIGIPVRDIDPEMTELSVLKELNSTIRAYLRSNPV